MAKVLNSTSVSARRAKAISLIKAGVVHSQSDLVKLLKKAGFADDIALALLLEPLTYPATILPTPNWLPELPYSIPYDDDDED